MQPAQVGQGDDLACFGWVHSAAIGCILIQLQVRARRMIVVHRQNFIVPDQQSIRQACSWRLRWGSAGSRSRPGWWWERSS